MAKEYFVSMENYVGEVTWSAFDSQERFERFLDETAEDGSGMTMRECFPVVHYQGEDENECIRVTRGEKLLKILQE